MNKDKIIKDLEQENAKLKTVRSTCAFCNFYKNNQKYNKIKEMFESGVVDLEKFKKQLRDRTKYIFVTECSAEQKSYFMPLDEYLDMNELPKHYEDYEYLELTDKEVIYLEDYIRDLKIIDMKKNLDLRKYYKIRDMFENGSVDLEKLKNIVLGDEENERK